MFCTFITSYDADCVTLRTLQYRWQTMSHAG